MHGIIRMSVMNLKSRIMVTASACLPLLCFRNWLKCFTFIILPPFYNEKAEQRKLITCLDSLNLNPVLFDFRAHTVNHTMNKTTP